MLDNRPLLQYTGITIVEVQQSEAGKQGLMPLALGSTASLRDPTAALRKPNFYGSFSDASDLFAAFRFRKAKGCGAMCAAVLGFFVKSVRPLFLKEATCVRIVKSKIF